MSGGSPGLTLGAGDPITFCTGVSVAEIAFHPTTVEALRDTTDAAARALREEAD